MNTRNTQTDKNTEKMYTKEDWLYFLIRTQQSIFWVFGCFLQ